MTIAAAILLLWTLIMLAVHIASRHVVNRAWNPDGQPTWLTLAALVRFEGLYYVAALIYGTVERQRVLLVVIAALALIHLVAWALVERRPNWQVGTSRRKQFLDRIQAFDWGESVALAYIAWRLVGILR